MRALPEAPGLPALRPARPARRRAVPQASSEPPPAPGRRTSGPERATASQLVERAAVLLDAILRDFNAAAFAEEGSAELSGEAVEVGHPELLRAAVVKRLPDLDEHFLAALNGYVNAASTRGDAPLLKVLLAVREETLAATTAQLPPPLQVVNLLSSTRGPVRRAELLAAVAAGGGAARGGGGGAGSPRLDLPAASVREVEAAAARLVEQMEDRDETVADAPLLVRCVLARESARDVLLSAGGGGFTPSSKPQTGAFSPSTVPRWEAALLKELVRIGDPALRRGLLAVALEDALRLGNNPDASARARRGAGAPRAVAPPGVEARWGTPSPPLVRNPRPGEVDDPEAPPPVRPGRFLDALLNLQADIEAAEGFSSEAERRGDAVWRRLADIRNDCTALLEDMAKFT